MFVYKWYDLFGNQSKKEKTIQEIIHTTDSQRVRKILFVQSLRLMCVL